MNEIRFRLKGCQPYFIEHELLPKLYFKENEKNTEYWIFYYAFIRGLSDEAIGIRLGYSRQHILKLTKNILEANLFLVLEFLKTQEKEVTE